MVRINLIKSNKDPIERLSSRLSRFWQDPQDRFRMREVIAALDASYDLSTKLAREEGVGDILEQMVDRIARAYGNLSNLQGKRILDVPCGSKTSRAPATLSGPFFRRGKGFAQDSYTALFEPWFCRMLVELGADPVGVDLGDLDGEEFEHYGVDLGQPGALNFLPSHSFDAVQDSRLFGSPEFTSQFPNAEDRLQVAAEIWRQEQRVLKPGGIVIHSDAMELVNPRI